MATSNVFGERLDIGKTTPRRASDYLPALKWLATYKRQDLVGDTLAGLIVAIMLVPQGMAYALLAGLPPEVGLYASILPLIVYGLLGSSRTLAVGPVAIVSLLVATTISPLAKTGSATYLQLALTLALLAGLIQVVMGLIRLGFLVNFLSHPVISGFTSAAAIIIGFSQLKHLLGFPVPRTEQFYKQVIYIYQHLDERSLLTILIGGGSIGILLYFKHYLGDQLQAQGWALHWIMPFTKSSPLIIVLLGTLVTWGFGLNNAAGLKIVGDVPAGLPSFTWPIFDGGLWQILLPGALTISFVGYIESISVGNSLASKRRQKVDANQEALALAMANLAATFSGGYPVTGGFSRSVVNFTAGANTGLASIITAGLIALTVIFLTPLFYYLPMAVLAAIIIVAVFGLIDLKTAQHVWQYNKADAISLIGTFVAVLAIGIEQGILVGVVISLGLYLWRTSRPHYAIVGQIEGSETYRNILRHQVKTCPQVLAVRVDENLYFANTKFLEETILGLIADNPQVKHLILSGIAINFIDASALETLEALLQELRDAGVTLYLADIKGPVMDCLKKIGFIKAVGEEHIFLSTHQAMQALQCVQ